MSDSFISRLEVNENMEAFAVTDHDYQGGADYKGEVKQLWGKEALNNAVLMWFASMFGEIIRQPQRGGYVRRILMKPMSQIDSGDVKMAIRDGFNQDFEPLMQIYEDYFTVTPDYDNKKWIIYMRLYSPNLKIITEVSAEVKAKI